MTSRAMLSPMLARKAVSAVGPSSRYMTDFAISAAATVSARISSVIAAARSASAFVGGWPAPALMSRRRVMNQSSLRNFLSAMSILPGAVESRVATAVAITASPKVRASRSLAVEPLDSDRERLRLVTVGMGCAVDHALSAEVLVTGPELASATHWSSHSG